jgi:hypothetical protein
MAHEIRREEVDAGGEPADESESNSEGGLECHRKASVAIGV